MADKAEEDDDDDKKMPADMLEAAVEPVVIDGMAVLDNDYAAKLPTASFPKAATAPLTAAAYSYDYEEEDDYEAYVVAEADARPLASSAHWPAQATRVDPPVSPLLYEYCKQGHDWEGVLALATDCPAEAGTAIPPLDRTPLHEACRNDAPPVVIESLLAANPYAASARDKSGNAPLHLVFAPAAPVLPAEALHLEPHQLLDSEREEIVIMLIQRDPGAAMTPNDGGCTPLHLACGNDMVMASTLAALIQVCPSMASWKDEEGRIPLARYCGAGGQNVAVARCLLDAHSRGAREYDSSGRTPLLRAALDANIDMVETMLQYDPDAADFVDSEGRSALHLACQGCSRPSGSGARQVGGLQVVRLLLVLRPALATLSGGPTAAVPLHYACAARHPSLSVVHLLVETDPSCASLVDSNGYTPLHTACENGAVPVEIVQLLLDTNPAMASVLSKKLDTPLHLAAARNGGGPLAAMDTVRALLQVHSPAGTVQNDYGYTPLHCACTVAQPSLGIVRLLLQQCPDCVGLTTHSQDAALHLACQNAHVGVEIVQALLSRHVERRGRNNHETLVNKNGNTPLHEACFRTSSADVMEALAQFEPRWMGWTNSGGFTPLHLLCKAALLRDAETVRRLLQWAGAAATILSRVDSHGHNTLHSALHANSGVAVVEALLDAGADAELWRARTHYGDLPLHLACLRRASVEVITAVVTRGDASLVTETNANGRTPVHVLVEDFRTAAQRHFRWVLVGGKSRSSSKQARTQVDVCYDKVMALLLRRWGKSGQPYELHAALKARMELGREAIPNSLIQWALDRHPEQVMMANEEGQLPLHLEACVSMKKDPPQPKDDQAHAKTAPAAASSRALVKTTTTSGSHVGAVNDLIRCYPQAAQVRHVEGQFPLELLIQNGHLWRGGIRETLVAFPPALTWWCQRLEAPKKSRRSLLLSYILAKLSDDLTTLYCIVKSKPDLIPS